MVSTKTWAFIFCCLFLFGFLKKEDGKNDLIWFGLKGKVKSIRWYECTINNKSSMQQKNNYILKNLYQFNERGYCTEDIWYNDLGGVMSRHTYRYSYNGHNLSSKAEYIDGSLSRIFTYKYDNNDSLIELKELNGDSTFRHKTLYKYDKIGNMIETIDCLSDTACYKTTYMYNGKKIISKYVYANDDTVFEDSYWKYYPKENKEEVYTETCIIIPTRKDTYVYDRYGNLIERTFYLSDGRCIEKTKYMYNQYNILIEIDEYSGYKPLIIASTNEYKEFDKAGNWLKQYETSNDSTVLITKREIEYY